jgi:hypothetical protein
LTHQERALAFKQAIAIIPSNITGLVAPFPQDHLRLLWTARHVGHHYVQLLDDHPFLALLLAERRRFGVTMAEAHNLVDCKRRDLLARFGFPATPHYARLLARLPRELLTPRLLWDLRSASADDLVTKALTELPRFTMPLLAFITDALLRSWVTMTFLNDAAASNTLSFGHVHQLKTILSFFQDERPVPFGSMTELSRFLDLANYYAKEGFTPVSDNNCGPHPREAFENDELRVVPIQTDGELLVESLLLRHCGASYRDAATTGSRCFYAVHWRDVRATLCVKKKRGVPFITDLVGPHNTRVPKTLWTLIRNWLGTPPTNAVYTTGQGKSYQDLTSRWFPLDFR